MHRGAVPRLVFVAWLASAGTGAAQTPRPPDTLTIVVDSLQLRALVWRPAGEGPFPAVLFNHGSYQTRDSAVMLEATVLGPLFAAHGYLFLLLFRQGVGLSVGQGIAGGDLMARARAAGGQATRNRVQWQLLEGAEGEQARAALRLLRSRSDVDPRRIGIVGHSFGGSLSLLLAARDSNVRAVVVFGAAAGSWTSAPALRAALRAAVRTTAAPVLFVHAANDYSTVPGQELAAEMQRAGKHHRLTILAPFGQTADDGHNVVFRNIPMWESAVLDFLRQHL